MKRKNVILIVSALVLSLSLVACGNKAEDGANTPPANQEQTQDENSTEKQDEQTNELQIFTVEELAKFNGKDGNPAYIAIDGIVYDVTDHPAWKDGGHNGFEAGQDLTEAIKNESPHGIGKIADLTPVGALEEK